MTGGESVSNGETEIPWKLKLLTIIEIVKRNILKGCKNMHILPNIHPGEVLDEEFLKPMNISAYRLAKETKIPQTRVSQLIKGKRRLSANTALRFSKFFGNSPQFWLGLQNDYDLEEEKKTIEQELHDINTFKDLSRAS